MSSSVKTLLKIASLMWACETGSGERRKTMDPGAGAGRQLEGLISLLQNDGALHTDLENVLMRAKRSTSQITPDAKEAMDQALKSTIEEIEQEVDNKISRQHQLTQKALDSKLQTLQTQAGAATTVKAKADKADRDWFDCRADEKSLVKKYEQAVEAAAAAQAATAEPCELKLSRAPFTADLKFDSFKCDLSAGNCRSELDEYQQKVDGRVHGLESKQEKGQLSYNEAKEACEVATTQAEKATADAELANSAVEAKKTACMTLHEARSMSLCDFAEKLKTKCAAQADYHSFDSSIDKVDGDKHSEADRVKEWEASHVTKCILKTIVNEPELNDVQIDSATLNACKAAANYKTDVGTITRYTDEFQTLSGPDSFTCEETTMTFHNGLTWKVLGEGTSADYKTVDYKPKVDLGTSTFDFCKAGGGEGTEQL